MNNQNTEQEFLEFFDQNDRSHLRLNPVGIDFHVKFTFLETNQQPFDTTVQGLHTIMNYVESGRFIADANTYLTPQDVQNLLDDLEWIKRWLFHLT